MRLPTELLFAFVAELPVRCVGKDGPAGSWAFSRNLLPGRQLDPCRADGGRGRMDRERKTWSSLRYA